MADLDPNIITLHAAMEMKEKAVRELGVGAGIPMTLNLRREGVTLGLALLVHDVERRLAVIHDAVALSDADNAILVTDAYGFASSERQDLGEGELARRFASGDMSVYECLQLFSTDQHGNHAHRQIAYTYDGRTIVWDEEYEVEDKYLVVRPLVEAMESGFEHQATRPGPAFSPIEIATMLQCEFIVPMMSPPPRNQPCPCGSGTKAKFCCWT